MSSSTNRQVTNENNNNNQLVKGKHLLNSLETAVNDNLLGFVLTQPHLQVIPSLSVVVSKEVVNGDCKQRCLILSGAGSGHEPLAHGFVGPGGVAASVAGEVFASPSTGHVLETIRLLAGKNHEHEVFVVVNNYTGDRLNFGLAVERAKLEKISTELFCFGDDVAFSGHQKVGIKTGKRGLAGGTLLFKCLGSLATRGHSLSELLDYAAALTSKIATMSVSLTSCNVPGSGRTFELPDDEMELGLGAHGESGLFRTKLLTSRDVVNIMLDTIFDPNRSLIADGDAKRVVLLVNNLGGLSNFEINIVAKDAITEITKRGHRIERVLVGPYLTSFSMNGVSISLMEIDDTTIQLIDDPTMTAVFPSLERKPFNTINEDPILNINIKTREEEQIWMKLPGCSSALFKNILKISAEALIANEDKLNQLDRIAGDGDCGLTCKKGALAILKLVDSDSVPSFLDLAAICNREMGGTSGAIYSLMFTAFHRSLLEHSQKNDVADDTTEVVKFWSEALNHAMETITKYSWAEVGDRTLLESLHAAYKSLNGFVKCGPCNEPIDVLASKVSGAVQTTAEGTASMAAKAGRASYVNSDRVDQPDPGAIAVSCWVTAIANHLIGGRRR